MSREKIVRMANQIAAFFATAAGDDAPAQIADHIEKFWEPRMKAQLADIAADDAAGLDGLVLRAMPLIHIRGNTGKQAGSA